MLGRTTVPVNVGEAAGALASKDVPRSAILLIVSAASATFPLVMAESAILSDVTAEFTIFASVTAPVEILEGVI